MDLGLLLMHLEVGEGRCGEQFRHFVGTGERLLQSPDTRRVRGGEEVVLKAPTLVLVPPGRHGEDTSRPEHPPELGGRTRGIGKEEQRKGSREYVEPGIGEVQMFGVHDPQVDLGDSRRANVCPRELDHGRRHVNPGEPADPSRCRRDEDRTATAGDVEHVGIASRGSEVDQPLGEVGVVGLADSVVGGRRPIEHTRQPRLVIIHEPTLVFDPMSGLEDDIGYG